MGIKAHAALSPSKNTVHKVTAIKSNVATNSIGAGSGTCGTVTISGQAGASKLSVYTYKGSGSIGTIDVHIVHSAGCFPRSALASNS